MNEECQCVFSTFEVFERFISKTIDPAPVAEPVKEVARTKTPAYTVRLE